MLAKIVNTLYLGCLWIPIQAYKKVNESQYTVEMAYCALHLEMHSSEGEKYAEDVVWHKKMKEDSITEVNTHFLYQNLHVCE